MTITLDHTESVAQHIQTFWFRPEKLLRYTAGQFVELTLKHDHPDNRGERRWFTISSAPSDTQLFSITTKFADDHPSTFKQALWALKPGDSLKTSMPMGDFVLPKDKNRRLLFIAGGIGITPFHSMIESLVQADEKRDITLIYAARTPKEFAFKKLLAQPWLNVTYQTKPLSADEIMSQIPDLKDAIIYMSGPEPMVESLVKDFKHQGVPSHHLIGDYFPNYPAA